VTKIIPLREVATTPVAISVANLHWHYDRRCVLHGLSFDLPRGSMVAVLGANGAGKTTLLRLLAGNLRPMQGEITLAPDLRANVAYLPQQSMIERQFPITTAEIVGMGMPRISRRERAAKIHAALEQMDLLSQANFPISELSAGQLKRALLARIMVQGAGLLCLDEPFAEVDEKTVHTILRGLQQSQAAGRTVIVSLHNAALAEKYFDHALCLSQGSAEFGPIKKIIPLFTAGAV
jgi:zinc/manganese transport system ATP-binding protein